MQDLRNSLTVKTLQVHTQPRTTHLILVATTRVYVAMCDSPTGERMCHYIQAVLICSRNTAGMASVLGSQLDVFKVSVQPLTDEMFQVLCYFLG